MSNLYVACELGADRGRVMLGALEKEGGMTISDAGEFDQLVRTDEGVTQWDVNWIYEQVVHSVRSIAAQQVPVRGISFHTSAPDCLLFDETGTLLAPATRANEAAGLAQLKKIQAKVPLEIFYEQIGTQPGAQSALCQLAAESGRRLKKAAHALSLADGFNYLFSGVPRAESSQATQTQFYNPSNKAWSGLLLKAAEVPERLLPPVASAGTVLGHVRPEVAREAGLDDARSVVACSNELGSVLAALHIADGANWAFLWPERTSLLGTRLDSLFISDIAREMKYSNLVGFDTCVGFYKSWVGLKLIEQCHQTWSAQDRTLDNEVLLHLATSAPPFESLIDPGDARFAAATDMPQAIHAFCRETNQEPPRKPGPVLRCLLESLALQYRKGLIELEYITGSKFGHLYVLGEKSDSLLNHFLANALQIPVVVISESAAAVGNVALQALALGHLTSIDEARPLVRHCLRPHVINPHATAWTEAYDRFLTISPT